MSTHSGSAVGDEAADENNMAGGQQTADSSTLPHSEAAGSASDSNLPEKSTAKPTAGQEKSITAAAETSTTAQEKLPQKGSKIPTFISKEREFKYFTDYENYEDAATLRAPKPAFGANMREMILGLENTVAKLRNEARHHQLLADENQQDLKALKMQNENLRWGSQQLEIALKEKEQAVKDLQAENDALQAEMAALRLTNMSLVAALKEKNQVAEEEDKNAGGGSGGPEGSA